MAVAAMVAASPARAGEGCYGTAIEFVDTPKEAAALAKKKHRGGGSTQTQRSSSEETKAERERRLTRECKGMPNAGACLGYVHR